MSDNALDPVLDPKTPSGPIAEQWSSYKFDAKLVNPANKRRYEIIVVGTGLAGAAAAATLAELGYKVRPSPSTTPRGGRTPSPRRAASMRPRTTAATATASTGSSTTR
jgi:hypothetical protein